MKMRDTDVCHPATVSGNVGLVLLPNTPFSYPLRNNLSTSKLGRTLSLILLWLLSRNRKYQLHYR